MIPYLYDNFKIHLPFVRNKWNFELTVLTAPDNEKYLVPRYCIGNRAAIFMDDITCFARWYNKWLLRKTKLSVCMNIKRSRRIYLFQTNGGEYSV